MRRGRQNDPPLLRTLHLSHSHVRPHENFGPPVGGLFIVRAPFSAHRFDARASPVLLRPKLKATGKRRWILSLKLIPLRQVPSAAR